MVPSITSSQTGAYQSLQPVLRSPEVLLFLQKVAMQKIAGDLSQFFACLISGVLLGEDERALSGMRIVEAPKKLQENGPLQCFAALYGNYEAKLEQLKEGKIKEFVSPNHSGGYDFVFANETGVYKRHFWAAESINSTLHMA